VVLFSATLKGIEGQWLCYAPRWGHVGTAVVLCAMLGAYRDSGSVFRHPEGHLGTVVRFSATLGAFWDSGCVTRHAGSYRDSGSVLRQAEGN
jgi:hypothetical protein